MSAPQPSTVAGDEFDEYVSDGWQPNFDAIPGGDDDGGSSFSLESPPRPAVDHGGLQEQLVVAQKAQKEAESLCERLKSDLQQSHAGKEDLRRDLGAMEGAFEKLRSRYEAMKEAEAASKAGATKSADEAARLLEQYQLLKARAQDKLRRANAEIVRMRTVNELQWATLRARNVRLEARVQTQTALLEAQQSATEMLHEALREQSGDVEPGPTLVASV